MTKAIDEGVPSMQNLGLGDEPTNADKKALKRESTLVEKNYYGLCDEEGPEITQNDPSKKHDNTVISSIWDRGFFMLPQLAMDYSSDQTLLEMTEDHAKLTGGKQHSELGDGAPIMALFKLQRLALAWIRKRREARSGQQPEELTVELDEYASSTESETGVGDGDEVSSQSSAESDTPSHVSDNSEAAGDAPAHTKKPKKRSPPRKLTAKQVRVLTLCRLVPGLWHAMQESIIVNLEGNKDEWAYLGALWRLTPGRLKFMLGGGSVNEHLDQNFSALCGLLKFLLRRYRATGPVNPSYVKFDEWFDEEAQKSPVMARWRNLVEQTLLTIGFHDSMRQGMLSNLLFLLEQLAEYCAATGKWKYMRWINEIIILIKTMPPGDLMFIYDSMLVDMGSCYMPKDETCENVHTKYWHTVGRNRNGPAWVKGICYASMMMPSTSGKNFGAASGAKKPPTGHRSVSTFIAASVQQKLSEDFGSDSWKDSNGESHAYSEQCGVGGPLPVAGIDTQQTGRWVLRQDVGQVFFTSPSSVKRQNPPTLPLTAEKHATRNAIREVQTRGVTYAEVDKAKYKKAEMHADLTAYAKEADKPPTINAALNGTADEKAMYVPDLKQIRKVLAEAIVRWRNEAPELCQKAHSDEANNPQDALEAQISKEQSTCERRANSRNRLRSTGKTGGLEMTVTNSDVEDPFSSPNPAHGLMEWFEENRNIEHSEQGGGLKAKELAQKMSSTRHACIGTEVYEASSPRIKDGVEHRVISNIARSLIKSASVPGQGGRQEQMETARYIRRPAEIEALKKGRLRDMASDGSNTPWVLKSQEPPAASIGNAVRWRPPSPKETPGPNRSRPSGHQANTPSIQGRSCGPAGGSGTTRRQQICGCCFMPRVRGHVLVCTHVNRTCLKCRRVGGN